MQKKKLKKLKKLTSGRCVQRMCNEIAEAHELTIADDRASAAIARAVELAASARLHTILTSLRPEACVYKPIDADAVFGKTQTAAPPPMSADHARKQLVQNFEAARADVKRAFDETDLDPNCGVTTDLAAFPDVYRALGSDAELTKMKKMRQDGDDGEDGDDRMKVNSGELCAQLARLRNAVYNKKNESDLMCFVAQADTFGGQAVAPVDSFYDAVYKKPY